MKLLDGGFGHAWKERHGGCDFLGGCEANATRPETVIELHEAYFEATKDFDSYATTNSFVATPYHLARRSSNDDAYLSLVTAAGGCARAAASSSKRRFVAGCLPPLGECYACREPNKDDVRTYALIAGALGENADVLLAETLSSTAEAVAAVTAASQGAKPLWCSFTLADDGSTRLRSGEPLQAALLNVLETARLESVALEAIGVNCCSPHAVDAALSTLLAVANGTILEVLVYANGFKTTTSEWLQTVGRPDCAEAAAAGAAERTTAIAQYDADGLITPASYAAFARRWRDRGATIIGGCCGIGVDHMRAVAAALK